MARVLTLHQGGVDPAEMARVEDRAERLLRELAMILPPSDGLRGPRPWRWQTRHGCVLYVGGVGVGNVAVSGDGG
jgi:hypothetical protein